MIYNDISTICFVLYGIYCNFTKCLTKLYHYRLMVMKSLDSFLFDNYHFDSFPLFTKTSFKKREACLIDN